MANIRSAIKRVRQNPRRAAINAPRRTAAKTRVAVALQIGTGVRSGDPAVALAEALAALDRAAKSGAIHANAAARRKSRLARKLNAALGGIALEPTAAKTRTTGKAATAKAARARVAASRAKAEKGPKTAAGKARAALAKKTMGEGKTGATATPRPTAAAATPRKRAAAASSARAAGPRKSRQKSPPAAS